MENQQIHKEEDCWNCEGTGKHCDCSCHKQTAARNAKSTVIKEICKACGKVAVEVSREREDDGYVTIYLLCGHVILKEMDAQARKEEVYELLSSLKGEKPYPFQIEGIKFLENCDGRGILTDDVGLGKSIQASCYLHIHTEKWPFIVATKSGLIEQWYRYLVNWAKVLPQVLETGTDFPILPGMTDVAEYEAFLVSYDTLARSKWIFDDTIASKIKTVILDECQMIKALNAKRTKAVRQLCENKGGAIIGLSNTPIKNNASEFFNVLNLIRPERFYAFTPFTKEWVERYETDGGGVKFGGIKEMKVQEWNQYTKGFILRRTKHEVMPDLPEIKRNMKFFLLGKETREAYNKVYENFEKEYDEFEGGAVSTNLLGYMSKMRHIVGIAKVKAILEDTETFLESTTHQRVIGVHHKLVAELLLKHISEQCTKLGIPGPLSYHSGLNGEQRDALISYFRGDWNAASEIDPTGNELIKAEQPPRIMIASTIAIKEGVNCQFIQYAALGEQEWTPADEEQFVGRFSRIGSTFKGSVDLDYFIATDTIDELLVEIKARKRSAMSSTLEGKYMKHTEESIFKELMSDLRKRGKAKRWSPTGI